MRASIRFRFYEVTLTLIGFTVFLGLPITFVSFALFVIHLVTM